MPTTITEELETLAVPSSSSSNDPQSEDYVNKANYDDLSTPDITAELDNITEKQKLSFVLDNNGNKIPDIKQLSETSDLFDNYHNFYINFFLFIKRFINKNVVGGFNSRSQNRNSNELIRIKEFYFNYGSKSWSTKQYQDAETWEYPIAKINILDTKPFFPVGQIQRQIIQKTSTNRILLCSNETKKEAISVTLVQNLVTVSVEIYFEDSTDIINFSNIIYNNIPMNFTAYTGPYTNLINITSLVQNWEGDDEIYNLLVKANDPGSTFKNQEYVYAYFNSEPTVELNSIQPQVNKEQMEYSLMLDFIFTFSQPVDLVKHKLRTYKEIDVDIAVSTNAGLLDQPKPMITNLKESQILNQIVQQNRNPRALINIKDTKFLELKPSDSINNIPYLEFSTFLNIEDAALWYFKDKFNSEARAFIEDKTEYYFPIKFLFLTKIDIIIDDVDLQNKSEDEVNNFILTKKQEILEEIKNKKETDFLYVISYKSPFKDKQEYLYILGTHYMLTDVSLLAEYSLDIIVF